MGNVWRKQKEFEGMKIVRMTALFAGMTLCAGLSAHGATVDVDFSSEPFTTPPSDQFVWNQSQETLTVNYDSSRPTAKMMFPLGGTVTGGQSFALEVIFKLNSWTSPDYEMASLTFGLANYPDTGANRTGTNLGSWVFADDSDVFSSIDLAYTYYQEPGFSGGNYFANVFGADTPAVEEAFDNFASDWSGTTLPTGTWMQLIMSYDASAQELVATTYDYSGGTQGSVIASVTVNDVSTVNDVATFACNEIGISCYYDYADLDPSTPSMQAEVEFDRITFTGELIAPPIGHAAPATSGMCLAAMLSAIVGIGLLRAAKREKGRP